MRAGLHLHAQHPRATLESKTSISTSPSLPEPPTLEGLAPVVYTRKRRSGVGHGVAATTASMCALGGLGLEELQARWTL
jgi:hypothetical protein